MPTSVRNSVGETVTSSLWFFHSDRFQLRNHPCTFIARAEIGQCEYIHLISDKLFLFQCRSRTRSWCRSVWTHHYSSSYLGRLLGRFLGCEQILVRIRLVAEWTSVGGGLRHRCTLYVHLLIRITIVTFSTDANEMSIKVLITVWHQNKNLVEDLKLIV